MNTENDASSSWQHWIQRVLAISCFVLALVVAYLLFTNFNNILRTGKAVEAGYHLSNMENIQRQLSAMHLETLHLLQDQTDQRIDGWTQQRQVLSYQLFQAKGETSDDTLLLEALNELSAQLSRYDSLVQSVIGAGSSEELGDVASELDDLFELMSSGTLTQFNRTEQNLFPAIESGLRTLQTSQGLLIIVNAGLLLMLAGLVHVIRREAAERLERAQRHQAQLEGHVSAKTRQLNEANTQLATELHERKSAQEALRIAHDELEQRIHARTRELAATNTALQMEIQERRHIESEVQVRLEHSMLMNRVLQAGISTQDADEVLGQICQELAQTLDIPDSSIAVLSEDKTLLQIDADYRQTDRQSQAGTAFEIEPGQNISELVDQRQPILLADGGESDSANPVLKRLAERYESPSLLFVPLQSRDRVLGMLGLHAGANRTFSADEVTLSQTVAASASQIIENSQLYTQLQTELSERKRAQQVVAATNERLSHALRARDLFIATISHELRTPLNVILLSCEAMSMGVYGALSERQTGIIDRISNSGTHLLTLINDILDLAKAEANKLELEISEVDVLEMGREAIEFVSPTVDAKAIVLEFDPQISDSIAHLDRRRLKQVLINLLDNAIKFSDKSGHVGMRVEGDEHNVKFTVWDNGIGISPEHQEQLFEPFTQVDSGLSREYDGTGLGLALVERIAILHGGTVYLTSEVGHGSEFIVTIPRTPKTTE